MMTCVYVCLYECDRSFEGILAHSNGVPGCKQDVMVLQKSNDKNVIFTSVSHPPLTAS